MIAGAGLANALAAVFTQQQVITELCDKCHRGLMDNPCTCKTTCPKVYCDKRYETWTGRTCPIAYTAEYQAQPVPAFPTQRGNNNG